MSPAIHQPNVGPADQTPEWFAEHNRILTATDMAAVLGFSEYEQALDVYRRKKGLAEPFTGNEFTRRGTRYQPVILADYAEAEACAIQTPLPLFYHAELSYLGATPDAVAEPDREDRWGVEAKFSMSQRVADQLGEEGTDWIPEPWLCQVQTQMAVMGWQRVDLAVLLYGRLKIYCCPRNEDMIAGILSGAQEMWERLQNDDPPEPNYTHPRALELVKAMYGLQEGVRVELPGDAIVSWAKYQQAGAAIKTLEADRDACKARVLAAMGEAAIGDLDNGYQLVRSKVERAGYEVKPTSFLQLRQRKAAKR